MLTHQDHIGRQIAASGYYEKIMLTFIRDNIERGTYVDAGANIGNHSVYFAKECLCRVLAFEPDIENFRLLEENIKGLDIVANNVGLGAKIHRHGMQRWNNIILRW